MNVVDRLTELAGQLETQAGRLDPHQAQAAQTMRQGGTLLREAIVEFEALERALVEMTADRDALADEKGSPS